ncbi:MAG: hypothetical protein KJ058_02270 [Thermoanaerobaculia bacterium]|nr:hypothetical protein [Thermoanaerobaculia bacterium]
MSDEKHWVDSHSYRVVSDDGRTSWLYEVESGLLFDTKTCIEVAKHYEDGTTVAYEPPDVIDTLLGPGHGPRK